MVEAMWSGQDLTDIDSTEPYYTMGIEERRSPEYVMGSIIDSTAKIDATLSLGKRSRVRGGVVIEAGVKIGSGSFIGRNSLVGAGADIGRACTLSEGCVIGVGAILEDGVYLPRNAHVPAFGTVKATY